MISAPSFQITRISFPYLINSHFWMPWIILLQFHGLLHAAFNREFFTKYITLYILYHPQEQYLPQIRFPQLMKQNCRYLHDIGGILCVSPSTTCQYMFGEIHDGKAMSACHLLLHTPQDICSTVQLPR